MILDLSNIPDDLDWRAEFFKLNDKYHPALLKILDYKTALQLIASYDKDSKHGEGICPYGCDCPNIAQEALKK